MRRLLLLLVSLLLVSLNGSSQNPSLQVFVVATKTIFVWGESVQVKATVRDSQGVTQNTPVTWSVIPSGAATVGADGKITPLELMSFVVRAQANNVIGEVAMQVLPKQIVVKPASAAMTVGGTQKVTANAVDVNGSPIQSSRLNWLLFNASGGWDSNFPMASIDSAGNLRALVAGQLKVVVRIYYDYSPYSVVVTEGEAFVQISPPKTYRFTRVFAGQPSSNSSSLSPMPSSLIPTARGFAFVASLDLVGSALVEWTPGGINPIAIAGRAGASTGNPLLQAGEITSSHGNQVLFSEVDTQGAAQISAGTTDYAQPLLVNNSSVFGAENTNFGMSRNSLAGGGMKIILVRYTDAVTHKPATGLYRGYGRGLSESIVNTLDGAPGFEGQSFNIISYGIADDGTAWFVLGVGPASRRVLFRSRLGQPAEKIMAVGESFQNEQVALLGSSFFAANNGDLLIEAATDKSKVLVRWNAADGWTNADVLRSTSNGILWYEPAVGTLINGPGNGLYLWGPSGATPLLQLGDSSFDGSPVQQIFSATATEQGAVYAMIRTNTNPMLIVRIRPDRATLLKAGDSVPVGAVPVISAMLMGGGTGNPFVIAGGRVGSIARLKNDGGLLPLIRVGDPLPDGKLFAGVQITTFYKQASVLPDGGVAFSSQDGVNTPAIFVWRNGAIDFLMKTPIQYGGATIFDWPNAFSINSRGDLATQLSGSGIYYVHGSQIQRIMAPAEAPPNLTMTGFSYPVIDESGHVSFALFSGSGSSVMQWDGSAARIILQPGQTMPDGRTVTSISSNLRTSGSALVTSITLSDGQSTLARFINGGWQYLFAKTDRTASGDFVNSAFSFDVNARGDTSFEYFGNNYNVEIAARIGNTFHFIQSLSDFTPDGALLVTVTQILMNDDGSVFVLGVNDQGQQVIYKGTPEGSGVPYSTVDRGGTSLTATQDTANVTVGFGTVQPAANAAPAGLAIFQLRQNGVLVTEASVPMTQAVQSGRIYAEVNSPVTTGLAIANPNPNAVTVSFYFTDENGRDFGAGAMSIGGGAQIAAFLNQQPFNAGASFTGTFTFQSSLPVGAVALRGLINERGEFLITTLPIVPLSAATGSQVLPYFADGAGWTTQILLVNPSDTPLTGTLQFFDRGSGASPAQPASVTINGQEGTSFSYSIPARSSRRVGTAGGGTTVSSGSVRIVPSGGAAPSVSNVFSYKPAGITVSEAGILVVPSGRAFRMYVEAAGKFAQSEPGSMQSGIAIANPSTSPVTVHLELTDLAGSALGSADVAVPANGEVATFLYQISGLQTLPATFQGVARISSSSSAVSIVGLRARYNERNDFLMTTTRPFDETDPPLAGPLLIPHFAVGGGYATQFILLSTGSSQTGTIRFQSSQGEPFPLTLR